MEKNIFAKKLEKMDSKEQLKTEGRFQADCFQWFHNSYSHLRGLLYHVPNGEKRDPVTANLLKAKGVVAGVPDLVFHFRKRTYFFELKKPDGSGKVSEAQKKIHNQLDAQGFIVWIVDNIEDFKYLVKSIVTDTSEQFTLGLKKEDYYYRHRVFDYLYNLDDGQLEMIEDLTTEDSRNKFMNFVSDFIVEGFPQLEGFEILFTPDYKALYKKIDGTNKKIIYNGKSII